MKITIATGLYPPESGGPATFAKLAEDKLSQDGYEVTVLPFSHVRKYPRIIRHFYYFFLLWKQSGGSELILALDPISVGIPARFVAKLKRLPFIVRLGGDYAWEQGRQRFGVTCKLDDFSELKDLSLGLRMLKSLQTKTVKAADKVIAPSQYLKSIIEKWGIESEKIEVIYSVSYLQPQIRSIKSELLEHSNLTEKNPVLLSASRLVPWKGFEALIDVVRDLKTEYPNIKLLIAGDGPQQSVLENKIREHGLDDHIELLGRLERSEIEVISQQVDMFILNTEYEGFSHLLVECMQLGMPIITTNVGGNPELVQHGQSGLLVEYNNQAGIKQAIKDLADNNELRSSLVFGGKERIKEFTQEKSLERLKDVLHNVVHKQT